MGERRGLHERAGGRDAEGEGEKRPHGCCRHGEEEEEREREREREQERERACRGPLPPARLSSSGLVARSAHCSASFSSLPFLRFSRTAERGDGEADRCLNGATSVSLIPSENSVASRRGRTVLSSSCRERSGCVCSRPLRRIGALFKPSASVSCPCSLLS